MGPSNYAAKCFTVSGSNPTGGISFFSILKYVRAFLSKIWLPKGQKSLYLATPFALKPPTEGLTGTISVKFSMDVNGWPMYQMA